MTVRFSGLTRRGVLTGLLASAATAGGAEAPLRALRPVARPAVPGPEAEGVVRAANLSGRIAWALADVRTGAVVDGSAADVAMPPASVAKVLTAAYALDVPGPDHRFETRLIATGHIDGGIIAGDLVLAGGGDPVAPPAARPLPAARGRAAGVRGGRGEFLVWGGALPFQPRIADEQLDQLAYNPAVSGLNLNFNRVHFEWARNGSGYRVTMDARSDRFRPDVSMARMQVVERALPVYTYASNGAGFDEWTVARAALGDGGARWLPVRKPALYAGDVFGTLAAAQGVTLPPAREVAQLPAGSVVARLQSDRFEDMARVMLQHSTNITAETMGLTASAVRGHTVQSLSDSGRAMADWARTRLGMTGSFVDHSGLGDASRIAPGQMVAGLLAAATGDARLRALRAILRDIPMIDANGERLASPPGRVLAKTGTLNFVSGLAGYLQPNSGPELAFAIFAADLDRRAVALASGDEVPQGARDWNQRARRLQHQMLRHWAGAFRV
ncbi:MAG: D-alanyl-D-alanine carboxypeptidase [Rubellimicrobium sp.]|nr:D-alanyl-D-alanine carboxypeptidase [Rubellimicrobium sp.]